MATWTHRPAVHIGVIAMVGALLLSPAPWAAGPPERETTASVDRTVRSEITLLGDPSFGERAMVDWALARFEEAGLRLPDMRVEFRKVGCGYRGQYNRETRTIQVCDGRKMTLLHEMAHAWDHYATFDRSGFIELRGLEFSFAPDGTRADAEGAEHVAEILAWGLMDEETAVPGPAYPSQPVAEYRPRLAGLPNGGVDQLHEAFVFLAGIEPLRLVGGP